MKVQWTDYNTGATADAQAVPMTGTTGTFWFYDADNVELMVKVLDGTANNGKFWVMYGALTDMGFTMKVRDTKTGNVKSYTSKAHTMASAADVNAF